MSIAVNQVVSESFELTKKNFKFLFLLGLMVFGIYLVPQVVQFALQSGLGEESPVAMVVMAVISLVFSIWLQPVIQMGQSAIYLKLADGQSAIFQDLWSKKHLWVRYLVASLVYGLITMGVLVVAGIVAGAGYFLGNLISEGMGVILAVLLGIVGLGVMFYIVARFMFFFLVLPDKETGGVDSLKASWNMTRGAVGSLMVLSLMIMLLNLGGLLLLGIGLIFTVPMSFMAQVKAYRQLSGK